MAGRPLPKTLSADEVAALLKIPNRRRPTGVRNLAMLTLMYRTGLRVGEVVGLELRDWRRDQGQVELRRQVAKGGQEAVVYVDDETEAALGRWVDGHRPRAGARRPLFTTLAGGPVSTDYVRQMMKRYARRAGLDRRVTPHMLRHSFATELLRSGDFNIREVQQLLRHRDLGSTMIYTAVFDADLERKIRGRSAVVSK